MASWLGEVAAIPEDLGSISSMHSNSQPSETLVPKSNTFSGSTGTN